MNNPVISINDPDAIREEIKRRIQEERSKDASPNAEIRAHQYEIMLDNFGENQHTDFLLVCAQAFGMWEKLFFKLYH